MPFIKYSGAPCREDNREKSVNPSLASSEQRRLSSNSVKNCSQKDLIEKCCLETGVNTHTICIWSCGTHYWAYQYKGLSQNTKKNNKKLGLLLQPYHLNIFVYLCIDSSVMVAEWSSWTRRLEQSGAPFLRGLILTERPHASLTEVLKNIWMKVRTRPYNRILRQHSTGGKTTPPSEPS